MRSRVMLVAAAMLLTASAAMAQATTGSISGSVTDESKAVMPGVTITVKNVDTGLERAQTSDQQGRYRALNLNPGSYQLSAELQGFVLTLESSAELNDVFSKIASGWKGSPAELLPATWAKNQAKKADSQPVAIAA